MKKWIVACWLMAAGAVMAASTPEEMATLYFDYFKAGDMVSIADRMHEAELEKFQNALLPVVEQNLKPAGEAMTGEAMAIRQLAGEDDIETLRAEAPRAFFLRFMRWMLKLNPAMLQALSGATIQPLGHVAENDMAHVTYRIQLDVMGARVSQLKILSVRRDGEEWKLMIPGEIEGLDRAFKARAANRSAPAPAPAP